ncbi:MAG: alpha/beta hydrolase [Hyphomicrobiales bacterium]|nr:alpha/beta hydrolase [Hyphomicrobiales bacterium]
MQVDWTGSIVETREQHISYVRAGRGLPVVFLHGWPEFKRTWMHNLPVLADRFDCIAPDLRGFGSTVARVPRAPGGVPPEAYARDLLDFADALGLQRFAIVCHDVGSFIAQRFVHAHPDRIAGLFFFNCAYPGIGRRWGEADNFPELWYQQFHQKDFAAALVGSSREACRIYFRHFLTHWAHQKEAFLPYLDEWVDNFMLPGNIQGGFDWYSGVYQYRRRVMREGGGAPAVPPIAAPTYFLWGRHDPVLQFAWSDRLSEFFSNHTLECAEDAGHFVHFEQPELANARLMSFLTRLT